MDKDLQRLRNQLETAHKLDGLKANSGWKVLVDELEKLLEATRRRAISPDLLGRPYDHASLVGAHNALESFLQMVQRTGDAAPRLAERLKEMEDEYKEARKLGIHRKI